MMVTDSPSSQYVRTQGGGNVLRLLEARALEHPTKLALVDGERFLSFAALVAEIRRAARALQSGGLAAGDRLGVCLRDHADHLLIRLAAAWAGVAVLPMDWRLPGTEQAAVAQTYRLRAVVTEAGAKIDGVANLSLSQLSQTQTNDASQISMADDADLPFALNLSSGTTGQPKAAIVTHHNYRARIANNIAAFGSVSELRYLSASPLYFSAGSHFCFTTLLQGGTVILYPPLFDAGEYVAAVRENEISMAFVVPTVLRWLLALPEENAPLLAGLKVLLATASPLTASERAQVVKRLSPNFYDLYGSAGGGVISILKPDEIATHAHTVGRAAGDVSLEVVDDAERPMPAGDIGRVRLRGAGVAKAWFAADEADEVAEEMRNGWLYTGDLGALDDEGYLTLHGRADDVIVRGGANIYPELIESALRRCPGVIEAAAVGRPRAGGDPDLVAFVMLSAGADLQAVHAHCRNTLPAWMQPQEILCVDNLPRTTSGKVRRRDLLTATLE